MQHILKILILVALCFTSSLSFAALSAPEQQIQTYLTKTQQAQIDLLTKLVNINSGTNNLQGIKKVSDIVAAQLKALGFNLYWANLPAEMHHAPTLIATRTGTQGQKVLLIGHFDTVFPKTSDFTQFTRKNNIAAGPGVIDDKGGLIVILYALKALDKINALTNTNITIVLTGDEEDSGKPSSISRLPLIQAAKGQDVALDFEPAVTLDTATVARRGVTNWKITTSGIQAHSAGIFTKDVGDGAIFEMSRILSALQQTFAQQDHVAFNPGFIVGGTSVTDTKMQGHGTASGKQNVVAKTAIAEGDFRYVSPQQKDAMIKTMQAVVNAHLPNTQAQITFEDGIPAMAETEGNMKLLNQYSQVSEDLQLKSIAALPAHLRGAGDISHVASYVPANLAGLGAFGNGEHSTKEMIYLDSLPTQAQRAAVLIYRLTR